MRQYAGMPHDNVMEKILIGKIVSAVGLKGELKVYNYSDRPDIYEDTEAIYVDDVLMPVRSVRMQKNMVVLGLVGIDDALQFLIVRRRQIPGNGVFHENSSAANTTDTGSV